MKKDLTVNRIGYGLLLITIGVCYFLFHGKELQLTLYFFLLLPVVSFIFLLWQRRKLCIRQSLSQRRALKGEPVELHVLLENRNRFPCLYVELIQSGSASLPHTLDTHSLYSIPAKRVLQLTSQFAGQYRGEYSVGLSAAFMQDWLRLFRVSCRLENTPLSLLVLPMVHPLSSFDQTSKGLVSSANDPLGGGYEDYSAISDIIPYDPSQEFRKIHWKLTARLNELMVRQFEKETGQYTAVLLDLSPIDGESGHAAQVEDRMMDGAVSLLADFMKRGDLPIQLVYAEKELAQMSRSGPHGFEEFHLLCAKLPFHAAHSIGEVLYHFMQEQAVQKSVKTAVVFTTEPDEQFWSIAARLSMSGITLSVLLFERPDSAYVPPSGAMTVGLEIQTICAAEPLERALSMMRKRAI